MTLASTDHRDVALDHLVVEHFAYAQVRAEWGEWAVVTLLASLGTDAADAPTSAHLVVEPDPTGDELIYAAASACGVERRLLPAGPGALELLWSATFSLPLEAVHAPRAVYRLIAGDGLPVAVSLPQPTARNLDPRPLSLAELRIRRARQHLVPAREAAALATLLAVTAATFPAAARGVATTPRAPVSQEGASFTPSTTEAPATATTPTPPAATATTTTSSTTSTTSTTSTSAAGAPTTTTTTTTTPAKTPAPAASSTSKTHHKTTSNAHHKTTSKGAQLTFGAPASTSKSTSSTGTRPARRHHKAAAHHHAATSHRATSHHSTTRVTPHPSSSSSTSSHGVGTLSNTPGFDGPSSWTGTVSADPALTGAVTELSGLLSNGDRPPSFLIPIYMEAGARYDVPWEVLAAINAVETDYGRDLNTSSAGAIGWMQFEPSTWHEYGMAADGVSEPNPYDPRDAIFSAAKYLAAAGAAHDVAGAVYAYNHASWYVDEVMSRARAIAGHAQFETASERRGEVSVSFATDSRRTPTVRITSGVLSHYDRLIAAANMVSAANFPYLWGGGHEQPARFGPFDCSGTVSYVMQQAGYKVPTTVAGDISSWNLPSGPGQVTIFYNNVHTFMRIGDRYFGTSGFARPGGGAGWFDVDRLPAGYLAQFHEAHLPSLGVDSFSQSLPLTTPVSVTPIGVHHSTKPATVTFWPLMSSLGPFPGRSA